MIYVAVVVLVVVVMVILQEFVRMGTWIDG